MSRANELATFGSTLLLVLCAPEGAAQVASIDEIRKCPVSLADMATQACLEASSIPTLGVLMPLGPELFIDALGNVGMGTMSPSARLSVAGPIESTSGGVRFPDGTEQVGAGWGGARGWRPGEVATLDYRDSGAAAIVDGAWHRNMLFDGEHMWRTQGTNGQADLGHLIKLRASDGALLGTYPLGAPEPVALAFDGAHVWGLSTWSDCVFVLCDYFVKLTKVRASDGQVVASWFLNSSTTPVDYRALAFDGTHLWIARHSTDEVLRIRPSDGAILGATAVGDAPRAMAVDGTSLWVVNEGSEDVTKIRTSDGAVLGTFGVGQDPISIAFDGTAVWIVNHGSSDVTKLRATDGAPLGTFSVGVDPWTIVFDGAIQWVTHGGSTTPGAVTRLRASDGANLGVLTFPLGVGVGLKAPGPAAFDGTGVWFHTIVPNLFFAHELYRF